MATITANPPTVFLPKTWTAGETTISWNTESATLGRVWKSIDEGGGPVTFDTVVAPPMNQPARRTGSVNATITVGKIYHFKLKDTQERLLAETIVSAQQTSAEPIVAAAFHHADLITLPLQRIRNVSVDVRPDSVRIQFSTTVATVPIVEINSRADFAPAGLVHVNLPWGALKQHHSFSFDPLSQNTKHFFRITAGGNGVNPNEKAAVSSGEFTTGSRFAKITVRDVVAVRSGDSGDWLTNPHGMAEWEFAFATFHRDTGMNLIHETFTRSMTNGEVVNFPFGPDGHPLPRVSKRLRLSGRVIEIDIPDFGPSGLVTAGAILSASDQPVHKEYDFGLIASASQDVDLPDSPGTFTRNVDIDSGAFEVQFIAGVTIETTVRPGRVPLPFVVAPAKFTDALAAGGGGGRMMAREGGHVVEMAQGADRQLYVRAVELRPIAPRMSDAAAAARRWRKVPGALAGPVIALAAADGVVDFIATSVDGDAVHASIHANLAQAEALRWRKLGGSLTGAIAVLRGARGELHLAGQARDGSIRHGVFVPRSDEPQARWRNLGGRGLRGPLALAEAGGELHVFATSRAGGAVHHRGGDPAEWAPLGDRTFDAGLAAQTTGDGRGLVLFGFDLDRTVHCKIWTGRKWTPSPRDWTRLGTVDELDQPPPPPDTARRRQPKSVPRPSRSRR